MPGNTVVYEFHLRLKAPNTRFAKPPAPELLKGTPSLASDERAMKLRVEVPYAIFETPSLAATVTIEGSEAPSVAIDVSAATAALREALGVDVDVRVVAPSEESEA